MRDPSPDLGQARYLLLGSHLREIHLRRKPQPWNPRHQTLSCRRHGRREEANLDGCAQSEKRFTRGLTPLAKTIALLSPLLSADEK
jgi:hypothetical protein